MALAHVFEMLSISSRRVTCMMYAQCNTTPINFKTVPRWNRNEFKMAAVGGEERQGG